MEVPFYRYFIRIQYKGKNYHGWQVQPNAVSVQQVLDRCLGILLRTEIRSTGCGRTDAGVHAHDFYLHFDVPVLFGEQECRDLAFKLDKFLPDDIAVLDLFRVKPNVHARFSAISRMYTYSVSRTKNPFNTEVSWHYTYDLDLQKMQKAAERLLDFRDFAAFSKKDNDSFGTECTLMVSQWDVRDQELVYTVKANRFLRNMVRALVGTQLQIGKGILTLDDLDRIVESRDRSEAGESVPAHGLSLIEVRYPDDIRADF